MINGEEKVNLLGCICHRFQVIKKLSRSTALMGVVALFLVTGSVRAVDDSAGPSTPKVRIPILDDPEMADELISLNFENVDIRIVLKTIGDITGINYVLDDQVQGQVTVMSPTKTRLGDVYQVLETILHIHGFMAVPAGDFVKVFPTSNVTQHELPIRIGSDPNQIPINDSMVTQLIPLTFADADEIAQVVQPLITGKIKLSPYRRTNSLIVTDTNAKIHYLTRIIQQLDVEGAQEQVQVIPLKHASAQVLSEQLSRILSQRHAPLPSSTRARRATPISESVKVLADLRTNSIIVFTKAQDLDIVTSLVKQLDIPRSQSTHQMYLVYLKNAQASEVAESLGQAAANLRLTGSVDNTHPIQITSDPGTNALLITASAQDYEIIADIITKLDIVREQILVELLIVEISTDNLTEIGVDWATLDEAVAHEARFFGRTNFGPRVDFLSGNLEGLGVGLWKLTSSGVGIGAILHALAKESSVNILSTPSIVTSNHQPARIVVGENRAFATETRLTEFTDFANPSAIKTFEYRDVGITLDIVAHVSQGGMVRLEIESEFTKLIEDVTNPSTDTPTISKRQAKTVISLQSGSTAVIGGLIRDDTIQVEQKIPLLGDLPIVGRLFRNKRDRSQKTNLMIFITPTVMEDEAHLRQVTLNKKEQMQTAVGDQQALPSLE